MTTRPSYPPLAVAVANETAERKKKKPFVRRVLRDQSQQVRRTVQFAFLALNAWIAIEFLMWTRYFESQGATRYIERPAGVDGWLPIAGLMNLKYFFITRHIPAMHPSAMVLTAAFLLSSLLLKKTFCSWLCPIGTVSEYLWKLGRKLFRRNFTVPRWLDLPLRSLKYLLLAFFLFIVLSMSAQALNDFLLAPFGIIADVKMLNFFRHMSLIGIVIVALFVLLSVFIQNFWCRFLCPYGALMGLVSTLSPVRIRRDEEACIDCGKCTKACPSSLPVDRLIQIRSVECTSCMECVAACPAENALQLSLPPRAIHEGVGPANRWRKRALQPRVVAAALALLFFGLVGAARATGHWQTNISRDVYMRLVPHADEYGH
ncbi:MAG TPA: 4Fe-4S binding protein [Acidisarcina sp.]|nr:4Fe-4S binding protein [Acidisarcina sp.]